MHFHIGQNSPGYLPDETPSAVASPEDAYAALVADMERWAEDDDESCDALPDPDASGPDGSTAALVGAILHDEAALIRARLVAGKSVSVKLVGNDGTSRVFFAFPEDDADGCEVDQ